MEAKRKMSVDMPAAAPPPAAAPAGNCTRDQETADVLVEYSSQAKE